MQSADNPPLACCSAGVSGWVQPAAELLPVPRAPNPELARRGTAIPQAPRRSATSAVLAFSASPTSFGPAGAAAPRVEAAQPPDWDRLWSCQR